MKPRARITTAAISAAVAFGTITGSGYAATSHVIFRATSQKGSWVSRPFRWPGGQMKFRADMNCSTLRKPPTESFHALLISRSGRRYADFNSAGTGSVGYLVGTGAYFPAGIYHLQVTTTCTWTPWRITISTYRP